VFDWELATSGDALADLGYLLSTWQERGDPPTPEPPGPTAVPGFPSRAEIVERYARLSGRDVSDVPYWVAFARWRTACIYVGVRARFLAGQMADEDGAREDVPTSAEQGRQLGESARNALRELDF
jgi:aminoglycoside phosphotransferase (APT) family kinase protein